MPELKGISHVELTVSDSEQAAIWWQDVMGCAVVRQFRGELRRAGRDGVKRWTSLRAPQDEQQCRRYGG